MEATKHGPGNDAARSEPDDRPAVGGVQRERAMGARRVVVRDVLRQHRPQVPFVDDYQMVETLASQRPDETLGDRVRLRRPDRREQGSDADPGGAGDERAAVAAVAVVDEVARLLTPRRRRDQLAPDPLGGRMRGDVQMDDPPPVMRNEEEDVQGAEGNRRYREEVGGPDVRCMIAEEGAPGL
jgi:hypothetical protein